MLTLSEIAFAPTEKLLWLLGYLNAVLVLDAELVEAAQVEVRRRGVWWWPLVAGSRPLMDPRFN